MVRAQESAKIESSKTYTKKLLHKYKIPCPPFGSFEKENQAVEYAKKAKYPLVVKYDNISAGKGVFVCKNLEQAKKTIEKCFNNLCKKIIIEEFIQGQSLSFHVITDGYSAVPLSPVKTYKHANDGHSGAFTPGMGAYAPVRYVDITLEEKIATKIVFPLIDALSDSGSPFTGVLNFSLIIDNNNNPHVVGINSTFGDPEVSVILPLLEEDLFDIIYSVAIGAFSDEYEMFKINDVCAVSIALCSGGYPDAFKKGYPIDGLEDIDDDGLMVFHSATSINAYGEIITAGGRVLTVNSIASTLHRASIKAYDTIKDLNYKDMKFREDIAKTFIEETACHL